MNHIANICCLMVFALAVLNANSCTKNKTYVKRYDELTASSNVHSNQNKLGHQTNESGVTKSQDKSKIEVLRVNSMRNADWIRWQGILDDYCKKHRIKSMPLMEFLESYVLDNRTKPLHSCKSMRNDDVEVRIGEDGRFKAIQQIECCRGTFNHTMEISLQ